MADKMMRMAGRGEDGLAKALATNDAGELISIDGGSSSKEVTLFENQQVSGWAPTIDVSKYNSVLINVSGDFSGYILPGFWMDGEQHRWDAIEAGTDKIVKSITKSGIYVMDITALPNIRFRAHALDSVDGVSVTAILSSEKIERRVITTPSDRIVELARYSGDIEPGDNLGLIPNIDTSGVVFYFILNRFDSNVYFTEQWMDGVVAYTDKVKTFSTSGRGASEWFEIKGRSLNINLVNEGELPLSGSFIVYGVR